MTMKKSKIIKLALCATLVVLSAISAIGMPTVPQLINYQGMLTDGQGNPLSPDGEYTLEFRLWSHNAAQDADHLIWGRAFSVTVVSGYFNVILSDDGQGLADAGQHRVRSLLDAFAAPDRYLGITINGAPSTSGEIAPRQQILSAPYALYAVHGDPVGSIQAFYGNSEPAGWLMCDGRPLDHNTLGDPKYLRLKNHLKVMGKDALPDLRGRFLRGVDISPYTGDAQNDPDKKLRTYEDGNVILLSDLVGSVQGDANKEHNHAITDPGHSHSRTYGASWESGPQPYIPAYRDSRETLRTFSSGTAKTDISIRNQGDSDARPKNVAVYWIIKY